MSYKKVAVWGGTGNLGPAIVNNLVSAGFDVLVLSRHSTRPDGVSEKARIVQVDVTKEHDKLVSTLEHVDVVVSATGNAGFGDQPALIDASIEAGVKLFLPSEFGSNTTNELAAALPVFATKVKVQDYLKQKASEGSIGHVLVNTSAFLDWGLDKNFLINADDSGPTTIYNGGDVSFSATLLDDIGKTVAAIVRDPQPYWNKQVLVNSTVTTQNQLLAAAKKARPDGRWEVRHMDTETVRKEGLETLRTGQGDVGAAFIGFLFSAIFNPAYGGEFDQADSKRLGLKYLGRDEVEAIARDIATKNSR